MHPAYSVIWFTTLSGAGYGLAALLGLGLVEVSGIQAFIAYGLAIGLIGVGLISSTFHLGHPERALRAFSQWRSSWLSREGVLALITFVPLSVCAIAAVFYGLTLTPVGIIAALLCICTVYATSMIYASLRTIHHWYSWVTSACYLGFAASSGYMLLAAISPEFLQMRHAANIAIGLLAIVWIVKGIWWHRADTTASASTPETALGLPSDSNPRRLELPHTGSNYLLAEMGHKVARKHVHKLRIIAIVFGFLLPVVCLFAAGQVDDTLAQAMAILAAASHYFGIVVERWLFFAEARHTVMLYYGAEAA